MAKVNSTTISQADVDKLALTKEEQAKFLACYHHIVNQFKLEEVQAVCFNRTVQQ